MTRRSTVVAPAWFASFVAVLLGGAVFAVQLVTLRHAHRADPAVKGEH